MYDDLRDAVGVVAAAVIAFFTIVAICAGLSVFGWWLDAKLSAPAGAAQQQIQNNSGTNRTEAQDAFNTLSSAITVDQVNITHDKAVLSQDSADNAFDKQTLDLDQRKCEADVGDYNKDAVDATMKDWRPSALPVSYSLTVCN